MKASVPHRPIAGRRGRGGVTSVEMSLVLMVFLTIVFGMIELSIAVFRYHVVSQAARQLARMAIVRGEFAPPEMSDWYADHGPTYGPQTVSTAQATDEVVNGVTGNTGYPGITKYITGLVPAQTEVTLEWPDGNSRVGSRVTATVSTSYSPFITFLFTNNFTLTGRSTMQIAH